MDVGLFCTPLHIQESIMDAIKGIVNDVASRKLVVTTVAGAAAATGTIELTWPMAAVRWKQR